MPTRTAAILSSTAAAFAAKLRAKRLLDRRQRNLEQLREHADVDHVHQVLAQVALIGEVLLRQGRKRHGVVAEILAQRIALARKALLVNDGTARLYAGDVLLPRRGVERHQNVEIARAALIAERADAHVEPRRQTLDIRGEDVLGSDGDPEARDGVGQHEIGRLASRAVDRRHANRKIVYGASRHNDGVIRRDGAAFSRHAGGRPGRWTPPPGAEGTGRRPPSNEGNSMLALSHVILHVGLCGSIARAPANATIALRLRLTDRVGRRMLDRVYHFERGDEAESIVEFDSAFGMYRIDLAHREVSLLGQRLSVLHLRSRSQRLPNPLRRSGAGAADAADPLGDGAAVVSLRAADVRAFR